MTHVLDGYVRGVVLDVVTVEQRGVVDGRMVDGRMLQRSDALLDCMIVRSFDLVCLSLRLLVRERVLPQTCNT